MITKIKRSMEVCLRLSVFLPLIISVAMASAFKEFEVREGEDGIKTAYVNATLNGLGEAVFPESELVEQALEAGDQVFLRCDAELLYTCIASHTEFFSGCGLSLVTHTANERNLEAFFKLYPTVGIEVNLSNSGRGYVSSDYELPFVCMALQHVRFVDPEGRIRGFKQKLCSDEHALLEFDLPGLTKLKGGNIFLTATRFKLNAPNCKVIERLALRSDRTGISVELTLHPDVRDNYGVKVSPQTYIGTRDFESFIVNGVDLK